MIYCVSPRENAFFGGQHQAQTGFFGMRNFQDSNGREWSCRVTWAAIRRSAAAGVDLSRVEEFLGDWYRGSASLVDALWAVCGIGVTDISREDFENAIDAKTIEPARDALIESCKDFFPQSRADLIAAAVSEVELQLKNLQKQLAKLSTELPVN